MGEIVKIGKNELDAMDEHTTEVEKQNMRLIYLRKKQVYALLQDATKQRLKTSQNISHWTKMLSEKIFDPDVIDNMELNKAIALFKYVNNINLKMLSESNKLEEVLSNYIESGAMETAEKLKSGEDSRANREQLKHEIFSKLMKMVHDDSDDADIIDVTKESSALTEEEAKELETAEKQIDDNLKALDDEIDIDLLAEDDDE